MARSSSKDTHTTQRRVARSPEARENQLISDAYDFAERSMREGTASSQMVTHFLKLGSYKERLEQEKLKNENELLKAKVKSLESAEKSEEAYEKVIRAMREYSGNFDDEDEYYEDDEYDYDD